jgi:hypothetical protein
VTYQFSGGLLLGLVILLVCVAIPMKVGAHLVGAQYTGIIRCGFAAFVGLLGGLLMSLFFGGLIGPLLALALGFVLAIRAMLGTSILGAIGLTLLALVVSAVGFWALVRLGLLLGSATTTGVTV